MHNYIFGDAPAAPPHPSVAACPGRGSVLICFLVVVLGFYFGAIWSRSVDFPTGAAPGVLPMVPVPLTAILSESAEPTPPPSVSLRIVTNWVPASLSPSGASAC